MCPNQKKFIHLGIDIEKTIFVEVIGDFPMRNM